MEIESNNDLINNFIVGNFLSKMQMDDIKIMLRTIQRNLKSWKVENFST